MKVGEIKLYHVQFDWQSYWIEADSFANAVTVWKDHVKELWGTEYDGSEEPESVHLVHNEPVLRMWPKKPDRGL